MKFTGLNVTAHVEEDLDKILESLGFTDREETDVFDNGLWDNEVNFIVDMPLDYQMVTPSLVLSSNGRIYLKQPDGLFIGTDGKKYRFEDGKLLPPCGEMPSTRVTLAIAWDTTDGDDEISPEEAGLPTEVSFDIGLPESICQALMGAVDSDAIVDILSDEYGYCVEGINIYIGG